jgi:hypothetical protein
MNVRSLVMLLLHEQRLIFPVFVRLPLHSLDGHSRSILDWLVILELPESSLEDPFIHPRFRTLNHIR